MGNLLNLGCDCCTPPFCDLRCDPAEGETHDDTDAYASVTVSEATGMAADGINGTYAIGPESSYKMKDWPGDACGRYIGPGIGAPINTEMYLRKCSETFSVQADTTLVKERIGYTLVDDYEFYTLGADNIINHYVVLRLDCVWAFVTEGAESAVVPSPLSHTGLACPFDAPAAQFDGVRQKVVCSCYSAYTSGPPITRTQRKFTAAIQRYSWLRRINLTFVCRRWLVNSSGTRRYIQQTGSGIRPVAWDSMASAWSPTFESCTEQWTDQFGFSFGSSLAEVLALVESRKDIADDPTGTYRIPQSPKTWQWTCTDDYDDCTELMDEHEMTCTVPSPTQTATYISTFGTYELQESLAFTGVWVLLEPTSNTTTTVTHPMFSHTDPIKIQLNHA